jgi:prevent-host-death family protein
MMKFIGISEARNQSGLIQRSVEEGNVALTVNGKPFALVVSLCEDEDPAELERLIRKARAEWSISRLRKRAQRHGLDRMTPEEIDAELSAARAERKR